VLKALGLMTNFMLAVINYFLIPKKVKRSEIFIYIIYIVFSQENNSNKKKKYILLNSSLLGWLLTLYGKKFICKTHSYFQGQRLIDMLPYKIHSFCTLFRFYEKEKQLNAIQSFCNEKNSHTYSICKILNKSICFRKLIFKSK
jgi:hypothetical protein